MNIMPKITTNFKTEQSIIIGRVRLECILSTLPVTSRDQANFGKTLLFSFILGLGR